MERWHVRRAFRTVVGAVLLIVAAATPAAPVGATATAGPSAPGVFVPMAATRALDTRSGAGLLAAGAVHTLDLSAVGVPPSATAAAVNLTVTEPSAAGYVTVAPHGGGMPLASSINFTSAETRASSTIVGLDAARFDYLSSAPTHLVVDVAGYWVPADGATAGSSYVPVSSTRVLDTRLGGSPVGPDGSTVDVTAAGMPLDATAAVVTLTVTEPTADGYLTAWGGAERPHASNINFTTGQTVANTAIVPLLQLSETATNGGGPAHSVVFLAAASAPTHLVVDVAGYWVPTGGPTPAGTYVATTPVRVLDTRTSGTPVGPDGSVVPITAAGVPLNATAAVVTLTVTEPTAGGYLTAWGGAEGRPYASNVNFTTGQTVANTAIVPLLQEVTTAEGGGGSPSYALVFLAAASAPTHLVVDVVGWFVLPPSG